MRKKDRKKWGFHIGIGIGLGLLIFFAFFDPCGWFTMFMPQIQLLTSVLFMVVLLITLYTLTKAHTLKGGR